MNFTKTNIVLAITASQALALQTSYSATITVNTLLDGDVDKCTLRDAVRSFNLASNIGNCAATGTFGNDDRVVFQARRGTIRLKSVDSYGLGLSTPILYINSDMNINPTGSDITIEASSEPGTLFSVSGTSGNPIDVRMRRLKLKGGSSFSGGSISANHADLELIESRVSGGNAIRGGGIYLRSGELTLDNSTITGNAATETSYAAGGGVYLKDASMNLTRSTISNNEGFDGGGIALYNSTLKASNATLSSNRATTYGGAVIAYDSTITLNNTTISNNRASDSGGIALGFSNLVMKNSLIANSIGSDCLNLFGTVSADRFNIIEDGSCATRARMVDPKVGALTYNGGIVKTHALLVNSPAINGGAPFPACEDKDQRGFNRVDQICDIGSFEYGAIEGGTETPPLSGIILLLLDDEKQ